MGGKKRLSTTSGNRRALPLPVNRPLHGLSLPLPSVYCDMSATGATSCRTRRSVADVATGTLVGHWVIVSQCPSVPDDPNKCKVFIINTI